MCDPFALAAIATAQTVAGIIDAADQASDQNEYAALNKAAAQRAYLQELHQIVQRQVQERQASTMTKREGDSKFARAEGSARASMAEAGVAGVSADLLMGDIERGLGEHRASVDKNLEFTLAQLETEKEAAGVRMMQRIAQVPHAKGPNFFTSGLRIGAGIGSAFVRIPMPPYSPEAEEDNA
jgi:hypothetical protein